MLYSVGIGGERMSCRDTLAPRQSPCFYSQDNYTVKIKIKLISDIFVKMLLSSSVVKTEGKEIWSAGRDSPGVSLLCSVPSAGVNKRGVIPNHVEL